MNPATKKITLNLVGLDSNAFAIMGAFRAQARQENWTNDEIEAVLKEATTGNYEHLLATISDRCQSPEGDEPM
jgi:hypothetical protein